jgi:tetratricopeptide (TPR) repeat protein
MLMVAAAALVTFCRVVGNGFVWDDTVYLVDRFATRQLKLADIFTAPANGIEYLPVRDLTTALDFKLWGMAPWGHHLTSLLIHLLSALLVYLLAEELIKSGSDSDRSAGSFASLTAAVLFAVHPLQAQAVSWVGGRNVLLAGLFTFTALLLYLRFLTSSGRSFYFGALVAFLCAILSKATAVIFPLLLCLAVIHRPAGKRMVRHLVDILPFFLLAVILYFVHTGIAAKVNILNAGAGVPFAVTIAKSLQIPWFYIGKFLYPVGFSPEYDVKFATSLLSLPVLGASAGLALLIAVALLARRNFCGVFFGVAWYLIAIVPVLNFFGTNPVVADRYAYIPILGLCLSAGVLVDWVIARRGLLLVAGVTLFLVAFLGYTSYGESKAWSSEETLWSHGIKNAPDNGKNYANLGIFYFNNKEYAKAFPILLKIRETSYPWDYYDYCAGRLHLEKGELPEAIKSLQSAIARNEKFDKPYFLLGEVFERIGDYEEAYVSYSKGLPLKTASVWEDREQAEKARARIWSILSRKLDEMRRQSSAAPNDLNLIGELALKLDRLMFYDEALAEYHKLERLGMNRWQLQFNIGNLYKKKQQLPQAAEYFRLSLKANPTNPDAWNNLGIVCREMKLFSDAVTSFEKAMAIAPQFAYAPLNLALTYRQMGDSTKAARFFDFTKKKFPELAVVVDNYMKE